MNRAGTRTLPAPSIAIAGGGLIGLSIGWELARAGSHVTVFDAGVVGGEASWAGAGMLAPGGEFESPSRVAALALESRVLYPRSVRELEEQSQITIDYQECGALDLAYEPGEWEMLREKARKQAAMGIASKPVGKDQVTAFWPRIRSADLAGALFYPGDATVNPRDLVLALATGCRRLAVEIFENSPVSGAELADDYIAVETAHGSARYDALIVAAGAWSSLIPVRNAPPLPRAEPVRGHLIGFHQPAQTCNTILRHGHFYLLQRANGLLIAGASVERVGWDRNIEPRVAASLAEQAGFVLPHLTETSPSETWIGFRPGSDDLRLGAWHSKRLYLAYGHYRNGILLAPITAQIARRELSANLGMQ